MKFQTAFRIFIVLLLGVYVIGYARALSAIQQHDIAKAILLEVNTKDLFAELLGDGIRVTNISSLVFKRGSQGGVFIVGAEICGAKKCEWVRARTEPLTTSDIKLRFVRFEKH